MNKINLNLHVLKTGEQLSIDGITFEDTAFVQVSFESTANEVENKLKEAFIVFSELLASISCDGEYLIFTSASGIADDGDWSGVKVHHHNNSVFWEFRATEDYKLEFDRERYVSTVKLIAEQISNLPENITLEPAQVFYPEDWSFDR